MEQIKKYFPLATILFMAAIVSLIALVQSHIDTTLLLKDSSYNLPIYLLPLGYTVSAWLFTSTEEINQPILALGAVVIYSMSAFLLFVPELPPAVQWHYPIGAACTAYVLHDWIL